MLPFTVDQNPDHLSVVSVRCEGKCGDSFTFLLTTDVHWDNPRSDQAKFRGHLNEAKKLGAGWIDGGDFFCAMQGKYDKRANKADIRKEHQDGNYLDRLVDTATEFLSPFAENIVAIGRGNHETAIRSRHETDLTDRLARALRTNGSDRPYTIGYGGWVRFMFKRASWQSSRLLYVFHGTGGGGPVTRGVIQTNRLAVFNPDPHVVLTGHTHDEWIVPIARQRISDLGVPYYDEQVHVRTPGYKDGWNNGIGGWEAEKMLGPKPKGAAWLKFTITREGVRQEVTRAV